MCLEIELFLKTELHLKFGVSISFYNLKMQKTLYIAFLILLFSPLTNTLSVIGCPAGQVYSPQGCIATCRNSQCNGDFFITIYEPVCAWTKNGDWVDFSYYCLACAQNAVIGYKDGECTGNERTSNGPVTNPISRPPPRPYQRPWPYPWRPSRPQPRPVIGDGLIRCSYPRPTQRQCPTLYYIRQPDLNFCGVDGLGNERGFARGCQACKDKSIIGYKRGLCTGNDEFFPPVVNYYCSSQNPCRESWQLCSSGKCIDRCAVIRCMQGTTCRRGQCIPNRY